MLTTGYWPPEIPFDLEDLATVHLLAKKAARKGQR